MFAKKVIEVPLKGGYVPSKPPVTPTQRGRAPGGAALSTSAIRGLVLPFDLDGNPQ